MLHTPLIAKVPGMVKKHRINELTEDFDLMATILELENIEPRHHHYAKSLLPQLKGAPGDPDRVVFAEGGAHLDQRHTWDYRYMNGHDGDLIRNQNSVYNAGAFMARDFPESVSTSVMLRNSRFKLIYRPDAESELYDMMNDPQELYNLYHDHQYGSVRDQLTGELLNWQLRTADITPFAADSRQTPEVVWKD